MELELGVDGGVSGLPVLVVEVDVSGVGVVEDVLSGVSVEELVLSVLAVLDVPGPWGANV